METILQDLRYGTRTLIRRPGFSAIVIAVLAVGIGSNSAVFSVINSILFQPLPFKNPERLVSVHRNNEKLGKVLASPPDFLDWQNKNRAFEQIATFRNQGFILAGHEEPERLSGVAVSASLFPLLGIDPIKGRTFLPEEEKAGAGNVVILSYGLWQRQFGGDPEVVGKQIRLTDNSYTIIGVMPAGYEFPRLLYGVAAELWVPLRFNTSQLSNWRDYTFPVIGRLKQGISIEKAQADLQIIAPQPAQQYTATEGEFIMTVIPLKEEVAGKIRQPLLILLVAVGLVLLIACANAANLLLARAVTRQKEIAVRVAVGASRGRIVRQLLTESVLLAVIGGALGIALAYWGIKLIEMGSPDTISRIGEIKIEYTVLIFTLTLAILTGVIFGLAPALQASKPNLDELCRQAGARLSGGHGFRRMHSVLVVFELVIVLVLLVSAGLLINSFIRLQKVDPGFDLNRLLTVSLSLPRYKYTDVRRIAAFYQQALQQTKAIPGVESVGAITGLPIQGGGGSTSFSVKGYKSESSEDMRTVNYQAVSPDYFTTMGIALLKGRFFTEQDAEAAPKVAIIDEIMARRFWPDEDPVGQVIDIKEDSLSIVGVVGQVKHNGLEREAVPMVYVPYLQRPISSMILVIRSAHEPLSLTTSVRGAILSVDKDQPVSSFSTMRDIFDHSMVQRRFSTLLLTVFVSFAVLLAIVGIYSVTAYSVRSRTQEIGIRIALGAQPRDILKLVLSQGLKLALIGLGIGTVVAIAVTRFLSSLLYEISPTDPATFIESSLLLFAVTLLASFLPARRAARIQPVEALRYE